MDSLQEISALCSLYLFLSVSLCVTMAQNISVLVALLRAIFQCHIQSKWTFGAVTCQETTENLQSKRPVPNGVQCIASMPLEAVDFLVPRATKIYETGNHGTTSNCQCLICRTGWSQKKLVGGFTVFLHIDILQSPIIFLSFRGFTTSQKLFAGTQDSVHFWIGQFLGIRRQRAGSSPLFQA